MKSAIIIAFIVGIYQLNEVQSKIRTATTNYTNPVTIFFMEDQQFLSSTQVYGSCLRKPSEVEASCQFFLETDRPIDSPDHLLTCDFNVTFPWSSENVMVPMNFAAAIAKDKAVMLLTHDGLNKVYVLHFSNCTVVPVDIYKDPSIRNYTIFLYAQSPHDDRFDVLDFRSHNRGMFRRLTVNVEGQVVADVSKWFLYAEQFQQPFLYSPTKGRLTAVVNWETRNGNTSVPIVAVDDNGSIQTIREHNFTDASGNLVSAMNKLLTVCVMTDSSKTLSCVQYDENGDLKFETQLPHDTEAKIYNLAEGGFNIVSELCSEESVAGSCSIVLKVTRVDRTGKIVGSLRIPAFDCSHESHVHFFEAENGEQCFAAICPMSKLKGRSIYRQNKKEGETSFRRDVTCFSNEDYVTSMPSPIV